MTSDTDDTAGHKAELRWAGFELSQRQFEQYCEAWPHTKALCDRVQRDRSIWNEPANRFALDERPAPTPSAARDRDR